MRRVLAALIALSLLAAACGGGDDTPAEAEPGPATDETVDDTESDASDDADDAETPATTAPVVVEEGPKAPFTGLAADEDLLAEPALVVKISNNDDRSLEALVGLDRADVVIEERIEDRATRFAAIFHSELPEVVGPIRSARTTDLALLANLGTPLLVFSGANVAVLSELRQFARDDGAVLIPDTGDGVYHFRDEDFRAPDNLFIDLGVVRADFGAEAGVPGPIFAYRDTETDTRPASVDGSGVTVTGRDVVSFVHDPARGYVRVQDDAVHVTRDGVPLVYTNVVVMETRYVTNANDPESVDAITVGEGPVDVMIGGRRFSGTWNREADTDPYVFRTTGGDEIVLEPGKTWITLVPEGTYEFSVDQETQGLVLGGDE
ncbi:MAG: DUF3048 domain-containing protein [Actinomycetota bacterium]